MAVDVREAVKKPVKINFLQWTGDNFEGVSDFVGKSLKSQIPDTNSLVITTLEGDHKASIGDYIIQGVEGEFYPCKPSIFQKTYNIVE